VSVVTDNVAKCEGVHNIVHQLGKDVTGYCEWL